MFFYYLDALLIMLSNWARPCSSVSTFFFLHDSRIARTHYTRKLHTLHFFAFVSRSVPVKHVEGNRRRNGIAAWHMARRCGAHRSQSHQPMILLYTL